ncbi:MAG: hypothetical protein H0W13_03415 [Nitrospirales bacterium]|nr:hypothetical protein [Nitrospirales bacterium]
MLFSAPFQTRAGQTIIVAVTLILLTAFPAHAQLASPDNTTSRTITQVGEFLALQTTIKQPQGVLTPFQPLFAGQIETQPVVGMRLNSSFLNGSLKGEAELQDNHQSTSKISNEWDHRSVRVNLTGQEGAWRYGANYRTTGAAFGQLPDQGLQEVWSEWSSTLIKLRSGLTQRWDNVLGNPTRPRNHTMEHRTSMTMTKPNWPQLNLSYIHDDYGTSPAPENAARTSTGVDRYETSLHFTRHAWSGKITSSYFTATDLQHSMRTSGQTYALQIDYRPSSNLAIIPIVSVRQDYQPSSAALVNTQSASLNVSYGFMPGVQWNAGGSFTTMTSDNHTIEGESSRLKTSLTWLWRETVAARTTLTLDAGFSEDTDRVTSIVTTRGEALFRLQISS